MKIVRVETKQFGGRSIVSPGLFHGFQNRLLLCSQYFIVKIGSQFIRGGGRRFEQDLRQIIWNEVIGNAQDHPALDHIFQLAHVSRPVVSEKPFVSIRRNPQHLSIDFSAYLRAK